MTENCSSIILSNLPTKLKDPRSFTIPCTIGNMQSVNCLCDLGASIILMPLSLFRSMFGDQQVHATPMMADHSRKKTHGIVEDVLVKVNRFISPMDFVVLDYAEDKECLMILGRLFMDTGRALIDVHDGKLTLRIRDESVEFDMKRITCHPNVEEECIRVDVVDELVQDVEDRFRKSCANAQMVSALEEEECIEEPVLEPLIKRNYITPLSSEKPSKVELKPLPAHMICFLGS
ncbi:uncharacterized protein LOC126666039 [Mercurialis annua]|uniref:uncharacterized protein LOC126666039 n=1 Tax=Mercurialis annua TaxID=3986 RepID=UPI002160CD5D|nr:uncharacterized protein LOC126666039 [Mercurialis annua]